MKSIGKTLILSAFYFLPITFFAQATFIKHYGDNVHDLWNVTDVMLSYPNGDVLLASSTHNDNGNYYGIYLRRLSSDGTPVWTKYYEQDNWKHDELLLNKCIEYNGFTYLVGHHSFAGLVIKFDSSNGNIIWEKGVYEDNSMDNFRFYC